MPFGPVEAFDLPSMEERVLQRWRDRGVIQKVREARQGAEPWIFYEGPPTANGKPGLHHVWARVFKDLYPRFQTMRGRNVPRQGGWDCHGLPVELEIERELGFSAKRQIEEFGIAEFNARCRESVYRYVEDWTRLTERSGVWIDTETAYWTLSNEYIESVWWLVKRIWDRGLLYEGHRVTPYCPRCGTALSSHEMGQPGVYQDVTDTSLYVRFPLVDQDADLLVWTTTPWTLLANTAAAVGPDITYVRVHEPEGRDLIMATTTAERFFGPGSPYNAVAEYKGADMVGWKYQRPYTMLAFPDDGAEWTERVVTADYVTTDDGSGIVHIAPAFGEEDADVGRRHNLPAFNMVAPDGTFDERVPQWRGVRVDEAGDDIAADLESRGLLLRAEPYTHSYPHCWRCSTRLIYWAKTSWFIKTSDMRDDLMAANAGIDWHPEHIKTGRFGRWLEGNVDWALSRDRYWGTPLPIWRCRNGHDVCVGSVAELSELSQQDVSGTDLHRPAVDDITLPCPTCAEPATRLAPVLDAWFDSGSMPSSQQHYPFAGQDPAAPPPAFPADFICEAVDQTRGWFYSLLAVNTLTFGASPYRSVVCLGHIVDGEGQKMSKSRGNVIDPWHVFGGHGADALRWYFFSAGQPWSPRRVAEDGIREATRQTLLTLWNVWSFFATYADLDGWSPSDEADADAAGGNQLDRWILLELDDAVTTVTGALENFDALQGATRLGRFVDDLSNWYVRRSRPRFWNANDRAAHATLYRCLVTTAELLAPFCPFLADELWTRLTGRDSVHAADWPVAAGERDEHLAAQVNAVRRLVALGRSARSEGGVKVRQPLRTALVLHPGIELDDFARQEIAAELNVKDVSTIEGLGGIVSWTIVPNFRTLGPRLGQKVGDVKAALANADGAAFREALERDGFVEVAGERLGPDDVEIRADRHTQHALAQDGSWAVAIDLQLDEELLVEGAARELVRAVNDLRKQRDFNIADRVRVVLDVPSGGRVAAAVEQHGQWIAQEVLAVDFGQAAVAAAEGADLTIDDETLRVGISLA